MPAVNGVGEPCAGEPHARIEVAGAGNGASTWPWSLGWDNHPGNRGRREGPRTYRQEKQPRQFPTLHTFRARQAPTGDRKSMFSAFLPAISKQAMKKLSGEVRRWRLHRRVPLTITEIAKTVNPIVRGWIQYYGAFYRSALVPLLARINSYLLRWIRKKHKRLRSYTKAMVAWRRVTSQYPRLFFHWKWVRGAWQPG